MININSIFRWFFSDWIGTQTNETKPRDEDIFIVEEIDYTGRDCFETRIYDDLCEDILQCLPIADKIRLRGVSKQFHYCLDNVLRRRRYLKVDKDDIDVDNLAKGRTRLDIRSRPLLGLHAADELLQSLVPVQMTTLDRYLAICPNTIGFHCGKYTYISDKTRVLESVIQNCSHLESFSFDFRDCPQPLIDQFSEKFGKGLKNLELCQTVVEVPQSVHSVLRMCPNLTSLVNINFDYLFDHNDQIYAKNLSRFMSMNVNNKKRFRIFVKNNPDLKRLLIGFDVDMTSSDFSDFLFQISKLQNLIFLDISFVDFPTYDRHLAQSIGSIARNCHRLKSFALRSESVTSFDLSHCFQSFKPFYGLHRLCLEIRADIPLKTGFLDVKYIKNCRELIQLKIIYDKIDDEFFQGIHVLFPNLRKVTVKFKHQLTDEAMVSFGKLKRLESLIIERNEKKDLKTITDLGILSLLNGCQRLTLFEVHNTIKITENSVLAMIRKAVRHPDMRFKYYIEEIEDQFELHRYSNRTYKLPKNLVIMGASYYRRR